MTVLLGLLPPRDTGREVQVWGFILIKRGQPHLPFRQQGRKPFSSPPPPTGDAGGEVEVWGSIIIRRGTGAPHLSVCDAQPWAPVDEHGTIGLLARDGVVGQSDLKQVHQV